MSDKKQYDVEKNEKQVAIEKLQDDVEKLRDEVSSLEIQVAALSGVNRGKTKMDEETAEQPHEASAKFQRCKNCKYMRLPHRSNPHYTCTIRRAAIEPTWTCGLFSDKNNQQKSAPVSYVGH